MKLSWHFAVTMLFHSPFFSEPGFQLMNGSIAKILGVHLGTTGIKNLVMKRAEEEKMNMSKKLKNKWLYIRIDGATGTGKL